MQLYLKYVVEFKENDEEQTFEDGTRELVRLYFSFKPQPILKMEDVRIVANGHKTEELIRFLKTGQQPE